MAELHRRRRRVRPGSGPGAPGDPAAPARDAAIEPVSREPAARAGRRPGTPGQDADPLASPASLAAVTTAIQDGDEEAGPDDREAERGLRGLVGGGSSQVNVAAAMRARDATRPSAEDLAGAEANLVIIRRGWTPPPGRSVPV